MKQKSLIIVAVVIVFILGFVFWYWQNTKTAPPASQTNPAGQASVPNAANTTPPTLGAELYDKTQNPVGTKLPETNPFKNTNTNPLQQAVPNPF